MTKKPDEELIEKLSKKLKQEVDRIEFKTHSNRFVSFNIYGYEILLCSIIMAQKNSVIINYKEYYSDYENENFDYVTAVMKNNIYLFTEARDKKVFDHIFFNGYESADPEIDVKEQVQRQLDAGAKHATEKIKYNHFV